MKGTMIPKLIINQQGLVSQPSIEQPRHLGKFEYFTNLNSLQN